MIHHMTWIKTDMLINRVPVMQNMYIRYPVQLEPIFEHFN
jgi:hypothetical protein